MADLDIFSSYTLAAVVKEIIPEVTFFKDRYFPTGAGDIFSTDEVITEYTKGSRKMAAFVAPRIGAIPVERSGYEFRKFAPAYIGVSRALTLDDLQKRGFGEALYSNVSPQQRALQLERDDLTELDRRITRREEWMCAQTMLNNACTMQEYVDAKTKGDIKYVQFFDGENSEHKYTPANPWNSDKANIVGDVYAMCQALAYRGLNATDLVIGSDVADVFYHNEEIRKLLDKNFAVNFGAINERITYPGVSTLGTFNFRGFTLTIFVVSSTYEDDNGKDAPYFPKDAAMVTFPNCGHLMYGAITQMPYGSVDWQTVAASRVSKFFVDNENEIRKVRLATRPLAAPRTYCPYIVADKVIG